MNLLLCYENPVLVTGSSGAGKSLIINKLLQKMIKPGSTQLTEETILGQVRELGQEVSIVLAPSLTPKFPLSTPQHPTQALTPKDVKRN